MKTVIALVLLVALPAHADRAKAEQYFRAGAQAFKQSNFAAAAENFEQAYKEEAIPEIAFSAAQAYRRQYFIDPKPEYVQRAVMLYRAYLDKVKTGGRVGDASDGLAEMKRELDRLTAAGTKIDATQHAATRLAVSVTIAGEAHQAASMTELSAIPASDTTGAKATIDGKPVDLFSPVDVAPGKHEIEVTAPGYYPIKVERVAVEGASDVVEAELRAKPAHVAVHAENGADVTVDGKPAGTVPLAALELPAGKHTILITHRGREAELRELALARDDSKSLDITMQKTGKRKAVPWLLGGAGVLAIGATITGVVALSADSDLSKIENERMTMGITAHQLAVYTHDANRRDNYRDATYVLGGAALTTVAIAAALYWFDLPLTGRF